MIVLLIVNVLLGGAGIAAALTLGKADTTTTADEPTRPAETSDPTSAPTPEPSPTEEKPQEPSEELGKLQDGLKRAGYACYQAVTEPVLVHSCYLEPGTKSLDEQQLHLQTGPDGKIAAIEMKISYFEDAKAALALFQKTVHALEGTLLDQAEAAKVLNGRNDDQVSGAGTHNSQTLAWGSSRLFVSDDKRSYSLDLVAKGKKETPIAHGSTAVTIADLKKHYEGKKFTCKIDPKLESLKCQQREEGAVYTILAFDPCLTDAEKYELICRDHTAYSVNASVGFGNDLPEAQYGRFFEFLVTSTDFTMGGLSPETQTWLTTSMNDSEARVHRADFQQMHLSVEPGAGVYEEFPNVFQVEVTGHNLTQ